jgi:hypothetical protein
LNGGPPNFEAGVITPQLQRSVVNEGVVTIHNTVSNSTFVADFMIQLLFSFSNSVPLSIYFSFFPI